MNAKLLIVADLGLLKAFRLETTVQNTPHLEPVEETRLPEAHQRFSESVTDFAGRHTASPRKNRSAPMGDDHNLRLENKRRLIRRLAGHIKRLMDASEHMCWLAAHKEIGHQLLEELPRPVRIRVEKNLPRDLTKIQPNKMLEQFLNAR